MGFEWARPTSFAEPIFTVAAGVQLLRRRPQPVVPVELGDVGDQRGADPVPPGRHVGRRGLGRGPDDPPSDRDPRGRGAEPQDPVIPVPLPDVPLREAVTACPPGRRRAFVSLKRNRTPEDQGPRRSRLLSGGTPPRPAPGLNQRRARASEMSAPSPTRWRGRRRRGRVVSSPAVHRTLRQLSLSTRSTRAAPLRLPRGGSRLG